MNILVISPHHDDEVLGCGGTIIKHGKEGDKVWVVYITAGWSGLPLMPKNKAIQIREKEARSACTILGVKKAIFLKEEDRNLLVDKGIIQKLIKIIREIKPTVIYVPHPDEADREHRITYDIVREASWLSRTSYLSNLGNPARSLRVIRLYEVWTPLKDFFVKEDVTDEMSVKTKALMAYKSQLKYLNLVDAISGLNMYRGSMTSGTKKFAEVFQIKRP